MSLPILIILASVLAAVAFFLAGLLLTQSRRVLVATPLVDDGRRAALQKELEELRRARVAAEDALAEANRQRKSEQAAHKREADYRAALERERDSLRKHIEKIVAKEQTLAERLHIAEDENRAAFEREEKVAEMWAGQLEAAKHEHKRRDQALEQEAAQLRAQLALAKDERERLVAEAEATAARAEAARVALEELRSKRDAAAAQQDRALAAERGRLSEAAEEAAGLREQTVLDRLAQAEAAASERLAESERNWQSRVFAAEAAWQAKTTAAEAAWQAQATAAEVAWLQKQAAADKAWQEKLTVSETAWQARLGAAVEELHDKLAVVERERKALVEKIDREAVVRGASDDEKETLVLRIRAAEEVAEQRRQEAVAATEARRSADAKLKDYERLAQENAELREQRAQAEQEAAAQAGRDEDAKDARVGLAAAQAKLAALEGVAEENRRLRDEVAELRTHAEASGELEKLQAAHKQVRLDAELMARRLQELLHERAELAPLRGQVAELESLSHEVEYLRRREKDLEAQLYALGSYSSREMPMLSGEVPVVVPGSNLETNLGTLLYKGGPRTAVLADTQGFLIATAGETVTGEGLAAYTAIAHDLVARARALLPLADVESVKVTDANRMVLTCHLFTSAATELGVTTLGPGEPARENTTRAIAGLAAIVGGGTAEATKEDAEPAVVAEVVDNDHTPEPTV